MIFKKNSLAGKRVAIRRQIRLRFKQAGMWNPGVDIVLRNFDLKMLRYFRKQFNAY